MNYEPIIMTVPSDNGDLWFNVGTALVAAFIGAASAEVFAWRARRRERRERHYAAALSLFRKLADIYGDAVAYEDDVRGARERLEASVARFESRPESEHQEQFAGSAGLMMHEYSSVPADVVISDDEAWMMATAGTHELLNAVAGIDRRANSLYASIRVFTASKAELRGRLDDDHLVEFTDKSTASHLADVVMFQKNATRMVMLDGLVDQIESFAKSLKCDAYEAIEQLVHAPKKPIGRKFEAAITDPNGVNVILSSKDAVSPRRWFEFWRKSERKPAVSKSAPPPGETTGGQA